MNAWAIRLIAPWAFAIPICAQNVASPYDLARSIDSHGNAWVSLSKALGVTDLPNLPRCDPSTTWPCSVDVITVFRPSQVIVAMMGGPGCSYLRFFEDGAGWRYAGSQGSLIKNYGRRCEMSRVDGKPFL